MDWKHSYSQNSQLNCLNSGPFAKDEWEMITSYVKLGKVVYFLTETCIGKFGQYTFLFVTV